MQFSVERCLADSADVRSRRSALGLPTHVDGPIRWSDTQRLGDGCVLDGDTTEHESVREARCRSGIIRAPYQPPEFMPSAQRMTDTLAAAATQASDKPVSPVPKMTLALASHDVGGIESACCAAAPCPFVFCGDHPIRPRLVRTVSATAAFPMSFLRASSLMIFQLPPDGLVAHTALHAALLLDAIIVGKNDSRIILHWGKSGCEPVLLV